jgi:hypothetical protein
MDFENYVKPELLILIPVLYLIGIAIKKSSINDKFIPFILGGISIVLCAIWIFAKCETFTVADVLFAIFGAITQGVLVAGASVYANQLIKQGIKTDEDENSETKG